VVILNTALLTIFDQWDHRPAPCRFDLHCVAQSALKPVALE
jgi:hypothetical protein